MAPSFPPFGSLAAVASALVLLLLLTGCDAGAENGPGTDNRRPRGSLRIVQPRPHAEIPLWEEARQLGKMGVLFDVGSTSMAAPGRPGCRLTFRIDDRPPTEVHDRHVALIRKPRVGPHVLHGRLVDAAGRTLAEASVPFRVLPAPPR